MATANCNSSCLSGMQALFHLERSRRLLDAACDNPGLSGQVYRNTIDVAIRSLNDAVSSLQRSAREVSNV